MRDLPVRCADNYPVLVLEIVDFVKMRTQKGVWVFLLSIRKIIAFPEQKLSSLRHFDRVAMNIGMYIRWFGPVMNKANEKSARHVLIFVHIVHFSVISIVPVENRVVHN